MIEAKRIIVSRKRPGISQERPVRLVSVHQSAVARREFGLIELHDLSARTIEAVTDADVVRTLEAA